MLSGLFPIQSLGGSGRAQCYRVPAATTRWRISTLSTHGNHDGERYEPGYPTRRIHAAQLCLPHFHGLHWVKSS